MPNDISELAKQALAADSMSEVDFISLQGSIDRAVVLAEFAEKYPDLYRRYFEDQIE